MIMKNMTDQKFYLITFENMFKCIYKKNIDCQINIDKLITKHDVLEYLLNLKNKNFLQSLIELRLYSLYLCHLCAHIVIHRNKNRGIEYKYFRTYLFIEFINDQLDFSLNPSAYLSARIRVTFILRYIISILN